MSNFEQCCDPLDINRELCSKCPHLDNCTHIHQNDISHTLGQSQEKTERVPRPDERDNL